MHYPHMDDDRVCGLIFHLQDLEKLVEYHQAVNSVPRFDEPKKNGRSSHQGEAKQFPPMTSSLET